jgi:hypothetical protein
VSATERANTVHYLHAIDRRPPHGAVLLAPVAYGVLVVTHVFPENLAPAGFAVDYEPDALSCKAWLVHVPTMHTFTGGVYP